MKLSTFTAAALIAASAANAENLVRLGNCNNVAETGAVCQLFKAGEEISPEKIATQLPFDEVVRRNIGMDKYLVGNRATVFLVIEVG